MIRNMIKNRKLIWNLALNDFKAKYASSFLGTVWAVALPLSTILIFWIVFQVGLRNSDVNDFPFIVWYAPAFLIWTYFSDSFASSTNSIREYSYLVKKVSFPVESIPLIKVISAAIIHAFFLLVIMGINMCYGIFPSIYYLQFIYYILGTTLLLAGLGWLFSSLAIIIPDTMNVVNVLLQLGFWITPIIWNPSIMSPFIQKFLKLNPMYYVCEGYRETFLYQMFFWKHPYQTIYFWSLIVIIWILGIYTFKKIRPRFADLI